MRILVIGTGYVGLVTAACFAEVGHEVMALDIDEAKIAALKKGVIPIYEPGLEEIVKRNSSAARLQFTTSYSEGVSFASLIFLALPTPPLESGETDLSFMQEAAHHVAKVMQKSITCVNKSTVPVGTTEIIEAIVKNELARRGLNLECEVVSNPEFLKEGDAVNDFLKPDRIVIGVKSDEAKALMQELYRPFNLNCDRLIVMDCPSAEMTKYAANAMLASRISFMNEIAALCEKMGADISLVRKGIGSDFRIGYDFLYAGAGFGGSCFPKDLKSLRAMGRKLHEPTDLLDAIESVNERQKAKMAERIANYFEGDLAKKTIAIWGLAFKPSTDDMREAPSLTLIRNLLKEGAYLRLYDPVAMEKARTLLPRSPQITFCENEYKAAQASHAIVLMTEWKQFRFVDFGKIVPTMKGRAFFDGRNQYSGQEMLKWGFDYISIGKRAYLCASSIL